MKPDKRTIEQIGGFVTVHAALPPKLLKWAVKRAKHEGHKDISLVMQRGIDCLREPQKAGLPALAAHTHYAFTDTRWPRLAGVLLSVATLFVGLFIRWVRTGAVWP